MPWCSTGEGRSPARCRRASGPGRRSSCSVARRTPRPSTDVHVDIRPAFAAAGLADAVDVFVLSVEHGLQKPDPVLFRYALSAFGTEAHESRMVGDRAVQGGAAVEQGMTTLLLPSLEHPGQRRLHHALALTGAAVSARPRDRCTAQETPPTDR